MCICNPLPPPALVGMLHVGVFILLLLSGERNFGVRLNKPYTHKVSLPDIPKFSGTHADLLFLVLVRTSQCLRISSPGHSQFFNDATHAQFQHALKNLEWTEDRANNFCVSHTCMSCDCMSCPIKVLSTPGAHNERNSKRGGL